MGAELTAGWKFRSATRGLRQPDHLKREYFYPTFDHQVGRPDFAAASASVDGTSSNDVDVWADAHIARRSVIELESSSRSISTAGGWLSTANPEFGASEVPDRLPAILRCRSHWTNLTDRSCCRRWKS